VTDIDFGPGPSTELGIGGEYVTLEEFVAGDEPGAEPFAADDDGGSVIPARGLVVVYGNGGAGKTTALLDAALHLAAGETWLGLVTPGRQLNVVWIENEGPRPEFRKRLGEKLEAWTGGSVTDRIQVHVDPWEAFSFRDEACRDSLVDRITNTRADVLIAGPVKAIGMKGAGTDDDIAEFLVNVNDVRTRIGVTVVLVHHENRAGQISGAWESRPDTLVHVTMQGHGRARLAEMPLELEAARHRNQPRVGARLQLHRRRARASHRGHDRRRHPHRNSRATRPLMVENPPARHGQRRARRKRPRPAPRHRHAREHGDA
jgi:hypothetical protein